TRARPRTPPQPQPVARRHLAVAFRQALDRNRSRSRSNASSFHDQRIARPGLAHIGFETELRLRPRSDGDGRPAPTCDRYRVALATAQRHLYRPRPDTDVAHLHGRSSAPASRESVACRRSGVKRALHDDEQKPIRRLLLLRETGTLGRRVARISRCWVGRTAAVMTRRPAPPRRVIALA